MPTNKLRCATHAIAGTELGKGSVIARNTFIWKGVKLGKNAEIRSNVVLRFVNIGNGSVIDRGALLLGVPNNNFRIGNHSYIGFYAVLDGSGGLEIGDYVHIASPSVGIWTHTSVYQALMGSKLNNHAHRKETSVKIENNIWVGGNCTVYPGITIGHHSVILPNSVVNKDVSPYSVMGGIPAKLKRRVRETGKGIEFIQASEDSF